MRVAGFTPLCQQSLPLPLSISLDSLHPPSSNQHSFSTCDLHVFLGRPHFLFPFTSNFDAFLKTWPSPLLNTCLYHLTPFTVVIWTTVSFNPNISIKSSVLLLSFSFAPHIAFTIALSVLLKINISFSLKHHVSLPYNITDLAQLSVIYRLSDHSNIYIFGIWNIYSSTYQKIYLKFSFPVNGL